MFEMKKKCCLQTLEFQYRYYRTKSVLSDSTGSMLADYTDIDIGTVRIREYNILKKSRIRYVVDTEIN